MFKLRMKNPSLFATQALSYVAVIFVIALVFGILFFSTAKSHLEEEVSKKLRDIAGIAAKNAPFERLDLVKPGDDESRMVLRLKEKIGEIRETTGVENIFVFRPDSTWILDLNDRHAIGSVYSPPQFNHTFLTALESGRSVSTNAYRSQSGRLFISAFAPIKDDQNRLAAIVGVDSGTKEVEVIDAMLIRLYWIAGLGATLAFALALLLARTLAKPIRDMAEAAVKIGGGDYRARASIPVINELKVLAQSINLMAEQVQARDSKLKEISASVAHEIRNPLNSIKLLITLLTEEQNEKGAPLSSKTIETLHYEIGKLNRFLTEFLTYSRPMTLVEDLIDPVDLATSVVEMVGTAAKENGGSIEFITESKPPSVWVDRDRMEQSLLNVLLNAVEACGAGGKVLLKVRSDSVKPGVEFVIEDTGPGIKDEDMHKLFEPFYTTKATGTGLGLSNTEKIVQNHGGTITAENMTNGGARFIIRIPADQGRFEDN